MKSTLKLCVLGEMSMSSLKNITSSNPVPKDLAKKLGSHGIGIIFSTMWLGYHDLKRESIIDSKTDEDTITVEWYTRIYDRWVSENRASQICIKLIPVNQYPDDTLKKKVGKSPAIDFCFRAWNKDEGYFGAECKRLRADQLKLLNEYIENGVKRFVSGKYSSKSTVAAMIGYVQEGEISEIVDKLKILIKDTNLEENLVRLILERSPQYKSVHIRSLDLQAITLHHLFFDFVA